MRLHKLIVSFLFLFVLAEKTNGMTPILEIVDAADAASTASSRPLYSRASPPQQMEEADDIYNTIFMKYNCPMLLHTYPLMCRDEQRLVREALGQEFGLQKLIQRKVQDRYQGRYQVRFVPDTVFQMGAIVQLAELVIRGNDGDPYAQRYVEALKTMGHDVDFSALLLNSFPQGPIDPAERTKAVARFMQASYGEINLSPPIRSFYFFVCNLLSTKFRNALDVLDYHMHHSDLPYEPIQAAHMAAELMDDYTIVAKIFDYALEGCSWHWGAWDNGDVPWPYKNTRNGANLILNPAHLPILIQASNDEYKSAREGSLLLWRGEQATEVTFQYIQECRYPYPRKVQLVGKRKIFGPIDWPLSPDLLHTSNQTKDAIRIVTGIIDIEPEDNPYDPHSDCYANALLDGSMQDPATWRGGARTLDYLFVPDGVDSYHASDGIYQYTLPISEMLHCPSSFPFRVSTQNVVARLFSAGEFFHSRTFVEKCRALGCAKIHGISRGMDIVLKDMDVELGYLCSFVEFDKVSISSKIMPIALTFIAPNSTPTQTPHVKVDFQRYTEGVKPTFLPIVTSDDTTDRPWAPYINIADMLSQRQNSGHQDEIESVEPLATQAPTRAPSNIADIDQHRDLRDKLVRADSMLRYADRHTAVMDQIKRNLTHSLKKVRKEGVAAAA